MKLIYVTSKFPYGYGEAFIVHEIREIMRQGHDVRIIPTHPGGRIVHSEVQLWQNVIVFQPILSRYILKAAAQTWYRFQSPAMRTLYWLFESRTPTILLKNLAVYPKGLWLAQFAREWRSEHIHAHWASTPSTMAMIASEISGIPWSFTVHRWDIAENNLLRRKAQSACFARSIDRKGSQELLHAVGLNGWFPRVVHMGVPLEQQKNSERPPRIGSELRLIVVANLIEIKGHTYLLEALKILVDRGIVLRLDLAGDGPLKKELMSKVKTLGLERYVSFLGFIGHSKLLRSMQAGKWNLMVLPSIVTEIGEHEGIPVSLIEAMSCGIPVISTATGSIPELLDGGAGLLVPPKDPTALAEAIETFARQPALQKQLSDAGQKRVKEDFFIERIVTELLGYFREHSRPKPCGKGIVTREWIG